MNIRLDPNVARATSPAPLGDDPLWYKDAVIYQLHVKSFFDSNNDGVGDFPGLISKLDYIAELGVNVLWLLPFYPSPRRDDGYDIADYTDVHPEYGTIEDFQRFIAEAHIRGIRVITELVVNHTSDQHPWFQRARAAPPGSPERNFYVWSDSDKKYAGTRIIFLDSEKSNWTWDEEAKAYYWHRFYFHQPDLNFDNPAVLEECLKTLRFWLDMGVDGLRLDAVPYLVEREGTINENLPETHTILKRIRAEVDKRYPGRVLLAEANQWPEDVQQYFGDDNECHMLFHFPLMPRMYMALAQEDRFPITDILRQTPDAPPNSQWTTFLRNHDELTLEMVTDRERDYLWSTYASDRRARLNLGIRRRLAPLMERDYRRIELMNFLLLTIMGTPVLYYGDEIGMGDNIHLGDRDGVRTAMQWSPDRNGGFSRADAESLIVSMISNPLYGYQAVNVEAQWRDPHSLLNRLRRILLIRGQHKAFGRGGVRFLRPANRKVMAYLREYDGDAILCVANVSRTAQAVELDLSEFSGRTPVELTGSVPFPKIGQLTYLLTLPPFGSYWFALSAETDQPSWSTATSENLAEHHTFVLRDSGLPGLLEGRSREILERDILPGYLAQRRWFQQKADDPPSVAVENALDIAPERSDVTFVQLRSTSNGEESRYALPLAIAWEDEPNSPQESRLALARARRRARVGLLTDGCTSPKFVRAVLAALAESKQIASGGGTLCFTPQPGFSLPDEAAEIQWLSGDSSNSAAVVGQEMMFKVFRRIVDGVHPEVEMVKELTKRGFSGIAALLGDVTLRRDDGFATLMVVQRFVQNQGDGFHWSVEQAKRLLEDRTAVEEGHDGFETMSHFLCVAGARLGEMHRELTRDTDNPDFKPELADEDTVAAWRDKMQNQLRAAFVALDGRDLGEHAEAVNGLSGNLDMLAGRAASALREGTGTPLIRIHGDLHLGQVLVAAADAIIVDFEGEPLKPLSERRAKNNPMRDVAGMLRSFSYVVWTAMRSNPAAAAQSGMESLLAEFEQRASDAFLEGYERGRETPITAAERQLLRAFMLERAAYEVVYEATNRPDQLAVPLAGLVKIAADLLRG